MKKQVIFLVLLTTFTLGCINDNSTEVVEVRSLTGRIWMDRNLGAKRVAERLDDEEAYGDLYQWGRGADGHQNRNSSTTTKQSNTDQPGHSDFIINYYFPDDWRNGYDESVLKASKMCEDCSSCDRPDWYQLVDCEHVFNYYKRSIQNDNLWQGVNGVNNPCPAGFRLPTILEWESEIATWSSSDDKGAFLSPLKLPSSKVRDGDKIVESFDQGAYWSSTILNPISSYGEVMNFVALGGNLKESSRAQALKFDEKYANAVNTSRVYGLSVRCIKN